THAAETIPTFAECWKEPTHDTPVKPEVAASMNNLFADLTLGGQPRLGMTRIDGCIRSNDDVILYGRKSKNDSDLIFEDLVIAMQSIRGIYGQRFPSVSIDGIPGGYAKLPKARDGRDAFIKACREEVSGTTRVQGIPHDCRPAKVLLDA